MTSAVATHEIDLIPAAYRNQRALYRMLQRCGVAIGMLVAIAAVAASALHQATAAALREAAELRKVIAMAEQQQAAIDALKQQKQVLESEAALRSGLRARAPIDELLASIGSDAVEAGVWFHSWRFEQLGAIVPTAPAGAEPFFVVDATGSGVRSEISIAGRATDVSAVSSLVQRLARDERLATVRVQRVSRDGAADSVAFELAISSNYPGDMP
jgi:Tfp pilus assembly protein PilN